MAEATGMHVEDLGLFTDLYQLTMAQSYLEHDKNRPATFSLIVRKYPPQHSYLVAAGLTTVLEYLEQVRFSSGALTYLRQTGRFSEAFVAYLATWRFQGDVVALPEGSVFFINEPVLEVTAPIVDAQLVESFLVNAVHLQTLIATKAARCVDAARGRSLIDFALRREPALPGAAPLLQGVMRAGQVIPPAPDLAMARQRYATDRAHLAEPYRRLDDGAVYPVRVSEQLATLQHQVETALRQQCQMVPVASA